MANDLKCPKNTLVAFNFIFFVFGMGMMAIGIWGRVDYDFKAYTDWAGEWEVLYLGAYMFAIFGLIVVVVAVIGCLSSYTAKTCLLGTYFVVMLIIFVVECALAIYLFWWTYRESPLLPLLRKRFDWIMQYYGRETPQGDYWTWRMNQIQEWFDCCGSNGTDDYLSRPYIPQIPKSCRSVHGYVFEMGCGNAIFNRFQDQAYVMAIFGFIVAFLQVFCMALAIIICYYTRTSSKKASRWLHVEDNFFIIHFLYR